MDSGTGWTNKSGGGAGSSHFLHGSSLMIPIPVFWTKYTATVHGRNLKVVLCENCSTEYLYLLEREASGVGTSMYMLSNEGAADHAQSAAEETLECVLENDFDPVPCPACGHYQRYMFPKLLKPKGPLVQAVTFAVLVTGCLAVVSALYCTVAYTQHPNDHGLRNLVAAWSALLLLCLTGLGLSIGNRYMIRHFDPNLHDQEARLAIGRSRAVTRAEFEKVQQEKRDTEADTSEK
jgi:hypothetical protein